ncbi:MAG: HEAT repeat domain-containing protein [Ignavibacteriae bacterium]|nr:HEAT repeat domain-containing protein [Ignavibacteria bacterium]MBI3364052.1 HEAT repeat domain-containing protein [Ignavibacteriota bacterium]
MKSSIIIIAVILIAYCFCPAQSSVPGAFGTAAGGVSEPYAVAAATAEASFFDPQDDKNDPARSLYKEGYNLILDEQWDEARAMFADIIKKYPKSEYIDDAQYWTAVAWKHTDPAKARDVYKKFIKDFPSSTYYDDAVADLNDLEYSPLVISTTPTPPKVAVTPRPATPARSPGFGYSYGYGLGAGMRKLHLSLKKLQFAPGAIISREDEKLDPDTRLKMDALYAIGETKEDDKSFQTLKEVALNTKQPKVLRIAALDALSNFKKNDVLSVYVEIARTDTSEDLQESAIDFISQHTRDKNKSVLLLIDLFSAVPKQRKEQRESIFYAIADVGNDRAVDFLANVAHTSDDYDLRRDAVYYLGNIGGERARAALYEIIRGRKER